MTPNKAALPASTLQTRLSAYQRDLARHMLVPLVAFCALTALIVLGYTALGSRWPSTYKAAGAMIAVFAAGQLAMAAFRRNVASLSRVHGLICPSCSAALGFNYATLKRTGTCGVCGAKVVGEA